MIIIVSNNVANSKNHIISEMLDKLGPDTKLLFADGTFKTAPSMRNGHLYQILKIHAEYKGQVVTVFKAIMTNKTRSLYDAVYQKFKDLLPDSGMNKNSTFSCFQHC